VVTGSKLGITVGVMCAAAMALLDISIVNVAFSDMRASFGAGVDQISWVSTGYMIANIIVIPMTGWFQRRFGIRRYFTASIALFTAASALCGTAWSLPALTAFRLLQGIGGGAIIPTAQTLLFTRYSREQRGLAAALFGIASCTGPLLGPTVGGYLIEWTGWHGIFYVNVPIGIVAGYLIWRHVGERTGPASKEPVDVFGIALLATGMGALQYVLEEGNRAGWLDSHTIVVLSAVAVIALVSFIVHELETANPLVNLRVFKDRNYAAGTGINFLTGIALFGTSYLFSLFCGVVLHRGALDIGLLFLTAGVLQLALMPIIGALSPRLEPRALLVTGIATVCAGLWVSGRFTDQSAFWDLARPQMLRGIGLSFIFGPASVVALTNLPRSELGNASGLYNATRELGGSIGTAWMATHVTNAAKLHASHIAEYVHPFNPLVYDFNRSVADAAHISGSSPDALLGLRLQTQAWVASFNGGFERTAMVFAIGFMLLLVIRTRRPEPAGPGMHVERPRSRIK
jgi:DHA2 family multidrug resistance protein